MHIQPQSGSYSAEWALLPQGWAHDVRLEVDGAGRIAAITPNARDPGAERLRGAVLPGMPNLHSHAFQRGFAGRSEHAIDGRDDFWTWREAMYRAAAALDPETLGAIARYVFAQMLKAGYTSVAEFHYLHAAPDGTPYQPDDAMASALIAAADATGIGLTLLPVLYDRGGFDGRPLRAEQRRFHMELERILGWIEAGSTDTNARVRWGLAPHSLRAVAPERLILAIDSLTRIAADAPIHIHIAEQLVEVEDCHGAYGKNPVAWLIDNLPVDARWCLVHATHAQPAERHAIAETGAVVGLCPTTEANLGDGIFGFGPFLDEGGRFGVGSDSNVAIDPFEELRLIEYGQRLVQRRRNVAGAALGRHTGTGLWQAAAAGGAQALGQRVGALCEGLRADLIVLRPSPEVADQPPDFWLDSAIFAALDPPIGDVMAAGCWVVRDGRHVDEAAIAACYRKALHRLGS